jgi:hypothetical protein
MNIIKKTKTIIIVCLICLFAAGGKAEEKTFKLNLQKIPPYTDPNPGQMLGIKIFEEFQVEGKSVPFKQLRTEVDPKNFVTTESTIIDLFKIRYRRKSGQSVFVESLDNPPAFPPLELPIIPGGSGSVVVTMFDGSKRTINISTFGAPVPSGGFQSLSGVRHWGYKFFIMADTDIQCNFYFIQVWTAHKFSVGAREYQVRIPNQPNSGLLDFQFVGNEFYHWVGAEDDMNTAAVSDLPGVDDVGEGGVMMTPPGGSMDPLKEGDTLKDRMEFVIYIVINVPGYSPSMIAVVKWGYETEYTVGKKPVNTVGVTKGLPMNFYSRQSPQFNDMIQIYKNTLQNRDNKLTAHENVQYVRTK